MCREVLTVSISKQGPEIQGGLAVRTEEQILVDYRLLGKAAKGGSSAVRITLMPLDARPGEVDVKEEEEDAKADDGGLYTPTARQFWHSPTWAKYTCSGGGLHTENSSSSFINVLKRRCL